MSILISILSGIGAAGCFAGAFFCLSRFGNKRYQEGYLAGYAKGLRQKVVSSKEQLTKSNVSG